MGIEILTAIIGALVYLIGGIIYAVMRKRIGSKITVKKIENVEDADLDLAIELYKRGLPENERDNSEEIVRWIKEVKDETKKGICKLKDYFIVAKVRGLVCGFLYSQYYPSSRLMFISYMVVDKNIPEARQCKVSTKLIRYMVAECRRTLKDCEGVVFELEYPTLRKREHFLKSRSRIRHFRTLSRKQNVIVKEIKIEYKQPKLSLYENGYTEEKMVLMYGRMKPPNLSLNVDKDEVRKILNFLYCEVYGDHFENDEKLDRRYRQYLKQLQNEIEAELPEKIKVS